MIPSFLPMKPPNMRSFPLLPLLLIFSLFFTTTLAIQKSLAGVIDWHTKLLGIPRMDLPPTFHNVSFGAAGEKEVVVSVTNQGVLGMLDAEDGSIIWRAPFPSSTDLLMTYDLTPKHLVTLSGSGYNPLLQLFNASSGHLIDSIPLTPGAPAGRGVYCGNSLQIIPTTQEGKEEGFSILTLSFDSSSSRKGATRVALYTTTLDASTGKISIDPKPTWIYHSPPVVDYKIYSHFKALWTKDRINLFSTSGKEMSLGYHWIDVSPGAVEKAAKDLGEQGGVPILKESGFFIIPSAVRNGFGGIEVDSSRLDTKGEVDIIWFDSILNKNVISTFTPTTTKSSHAAPKAYTGALVPGFRYSAPSYTISGPSSSSHLTIYLNGTTSFRNAETAVSWIREEGLSDIVKTVMVELNPPVSGVEGGGSGAGDGEGLSKRLIRHITELKDLPKYLLSLITRFTSSSTYTQSLTLPPLSSSSLTHTRDLFGFQKLAVVASKSGVVYAIDSAGGGGVVWKRDLLEGLPGEGKERDWWSGGVSVEEMGLVRGVGEIGNPIVAVVVVDSTDESNPQTIAFHLDAFTGQFVTPTKETVIAAEESRSAGQFIARGKPLKAFLLPVEHCTTGRKAVGIVDEEKKIHLFPFCKAIQSSFEAMSHIHFTLLDTASQSLKGYQILLRPDHDNTYHSVEVWSLPLGSSPSELKERNELEPEIKVMESENGPISTLGRILYDRSTLYSYLNPHLVVATILHKRNPPPVLLRGTPNKTTILATTRAEIHVLDSVSGNLIYSRTIDEVVEEEGIEAVLSRNWLVYKFSTREGEEGERQVTHRLITVELYEGDGVNRKTESLETSTYAAGTPDVQAIWRSFILPGRISSLAVTTSKFGVSFQDLLFINDRGQLSFMPRKFLDPRRPDVPDKKYMEEMLIPYQAWLPFDTRRTISHQMDVMGLNKIETSPSLLESTSLIFSHGLDLFSTRITPSGTFDILSDEFNKVQLVLTILGLGVGIAIAKPAVERRMMKRRWY